MGGVRSRAATATGGSGACLAGSAWSDASGRARVHASTSARRQPIARRDRQVGAGNSFARRRRHRVGRLMRSRAHTSATRRNCRPSGVVCGGAMGRESVRAMRALRVGLAAKRRRELPLEPQHRRATPELEAEYRYQFQPILWRPGSGTPREEGLLATRRRRAWGPDTESGDCAGGQGCCGSVPVGWVCRIASRRLLFYSRGHRTRSVHLRPGR